MLYCLPNEFIDRMDGRDVDPVTGCDKISPGCKHCYAERMANRLKATRNPNYKNGFDLTLQPADRS
jgi:protein gp37